MVRFPSQNPNTHGVEGGNQAFLGGWIEQHGPLLHLPSRLVGKGDGQDIPGIDHLLID